MASSVFRVLHELRAFERRHFRFLETLEDHDLVREIGWHQAEGKPLTMKQLFLLDVGSVATVQRRLRRLRRLGLVLQRRCEHDRRSVELTLSPKLIKLYEKCADLLAVSG